MLEIQNFLDRIKKGGLKQVEYDFNAQKGQIAEIGKMLDSNNALGVVEYLKGKKGFFELEHPLNPSITLRAVYNKVLGECFNVVFFVDSENTHIICVFQNSNFINWFIYKDVVYIVSQAWGGAINGSVGTLVNKLRAEEIVASDLVFREVEFGYSLYHYRPAHYYHHILAGFIHLRDYCVSSEKTYFLPKGAEIRDDIVHFYPMSFMHQNYDLMESFVYSESLEGLESLVICDSTPYDLTLWLGLPGERRAWLEQVEGCAKILKILSKTFKKIRVFIDGMTAYDYQRLEFAENKKLFNNVLEATRAEFAGSGFKIVDIDLEKTPIDVDTSNALSTNQAQCKSQSKIAATFCQPSTTCHTEPLGEVSIKNNNTESQKAESQNLPFKLDSEFELNLNKPCVIAFKSLSGYDYRSKICYGSMCEFAIGDSGTTLLTPFQFCKIPGVVFYGDTSAGYVSYSKNAAKKVGGVAVDERYILQVNRQGPMNWDFHIPFEHIYNLSAEVLEGLSVEGRIKSGVKLERLEVPSVEIVAKQYEIKERFGITLNYSEIPLFLALEASFKSEIEAIKVQNVESQNVDLQVWANRCGDARHENSTNFLAMTDGAMACKSRNDGVSSQTAIPQLRGAKARVQNHLAYKLGVALIVCSKSFLGYLQMPFVLSYIKKQHKVESLKYKDKIAKNPHLKLSKLEDYVDYKDAIKEKECLTYKLGEALIWADRNWYKGGYVWLYFEAKRLRGQFKR